MVRSFVSVLLKWEDKIDRSLTLVQSGIVNAQKGG